jgi:hypothetical protein
MMKNHYFGAIIMPLAAFALSACGETPMTNTALSAADAAFIGAPVPASASNVQHYSEAGKDKLVLIRFNASPADAASFSTAILGGTAPKPGVDPGLDYLGEEHAWWVKTFPKNANGGEYVNAENGRNYRVIIAPVEGGQQTVWAAVFSS